MLKNKSKLIIAIITILLLISTISFATNSDVASPTSSEENTVSTVPSENSTDSESIAESDIRDRDLYLFDDNIVMDELVDGNVFLFGENIEITGKVNGSLYAFGNKVTFKSGASVIQSTYICANEVYFDGDAHDLYAFCNTLNMTYNSFIVRDLRVAASTFTYSGGVGRNAYVVAENFTFTTEDENDGLVYGDLNYYSKSELELSKDYVQGNLNYNKLDTSTKLSTADIIIRKVTSLFTSLLFTIVIFLLSIWITPKFIEKTSSFVSTKALPAFGIGLLALIVIPIISILLMISVIGVPVGFVILGLYILVLTICIPIVNICITYKLKEKFNFDKTYKTILTLIAISLVVWALTQIPYIGIYIQLLLIVIGLGIMFLYLFTKNKNTQPKINENPVKE